MIYLDLVICVYIICLLFSLWHFRGRLICPCVIYFLSFSISLVFARIYSSDLLSSVNEMDIRSKTAGLLIFSGFAFLIASIFSKKVNIVIGRKHDEYNYKEYSKYVLRISEFVLFIFLIFSTLCLLFAIFEFVIDTHGNIIERAAQHRHMIEYNPELISYKFVLSQLEKVLSAFTYTAMYVFSMRIVKVGKPEIRSSSGWFTLISATNYILYIIIFESVRGVVVELIVFFAICIYFWSSTNYDNLVNVSKFKVVLFAIGILILFIGSMRYVGINSLTISPLRYIGFYAYGGLMHLNAKIYDSAISSHFGRLTFDKLYPTLVNIGWVDKSAIVKHFEAGTYVNNIIGRSNTNTFLGRWYFDFGFIATIIIVIIAALVFNSMYKRVIYNFNNHFLNILFFRLMTDLVYAGYDDHVSRNISIARLLFYGLVYFSLIFFTENEEFEIIYNGGENVI